jgi:hypothetical protein
MDEAEVRRILEEALQRLVVDDSHLLENDLSERCIAARLAMYMQPGFQATRWSVDVEYNRKGNTPKVLGLPKACVKKKEFEDGDNALVVPDVIVHRRGPQGPHLLVLELKKTTNRAPRGCDRRRVDAFRADLDYTFGATIECETRAGHRPGAQITAWVA